MHLPDALSWQSSLSFSNPTNAKCSNSISSGVFGHRAEVDPLSERALPAEYMETPFGSLNLLLEKWKLIRAVYIQRTICHTM